MVVIPSKKRKKVIWKDPLEEVRIIEKIEENMKEPKYVLNILYNDRGVQSSLSIVTPLRTTKCCDYSEVCL